MSKFTNTILSLALLSAGVAQGAQYPGVGRQALPAEIKAWDIDVRPDFKGLPKGSGSVSKGQVVWEAQCASCHGTFGESNEVFITPLVGGVSPEDIKTGRTKTLATPAPTRTTLSKLSAVSTLWDYINRAMPWNAPKSLTVDEVYAVTAYLLNLGDIVPADFTLSDANIAAVQTRLPNRNGMTRDHGLWDIKGKPDVNNTACMKDCPTEAKIISFLPDYARGAHGNLAEQNRLIGAVRGANTAEPSGTLPAGRAATTAAEKVAAAPASASASALVNKSGCLACHGMSSKIIGPGFREIAAKYTGNAGAAATLITKIKSGGAGVWGQVSMPPQNQIKDGDIKAMVQWILDGAK